jgi:cysteine desulfurase
VLVHSLEVDEILVSTGSACSSKKAGNRMLESMGKSLSDVIGSIRISFSPYEEFNEEYVANAIIKNVLRFRKNLKNTKV